MRALVVDASALVEYLFRTQRAAVVARLIEDPGATLHTPSLADVEFTSALFRLLARRMINVERAEEALQDFTDLPLLRHGHLLLLSRVLAFRAHITAYDAVYVALAENLGAELVTADARLAVAVETHTSVRLAR